MPDHRYPLVVTRNDDPPTTVQVPAPSLEDAVREAEKAGWTVHGSADSESVMDGAVAEQQNRHRADIEARRFENQTLTRRDIERAVFWGALKALIVFGGFAIILSFVAAIVLAVTADQTAPRFMP